MVLHAICVLPLAIYKKEVEINSLLRNGNWLPFGVTLDNRKTFVGCKRYTHALSGSLSHHRSQHFLRRDQCLRPFPAFIKSEGILYFSQADLHSRFLGHFCTVIEPFFDR